MKGVRKPRINTDEHGLKKSGSPSVFHPCASVAKTLCYKPGYTSQSPRWQHGEFGNRSLMGKALLVLELPLWLLLALVFGWIV